jgi:GTP-binding protein
VALNHKPPEHLITLGNREQVLRSVNGAFLHGKREPRVAFVGRSNVGKSSLLNSMLGARLAQVSKQPGKTRLLHFYLWPEAGKIIADLPGYGYAKASKQERDRWSGFISEYLEADHGLERALVLLDARVWPTEGDLEALQFLIGMKVSLGVVFTKADGLKNQKERASRRREALAALEAVGLDAEEAPWVSARTGDGVKKLAALLKRGSPLSGAGCVIDET